MGDSTLRRRWTALSRLTASAAPAITPACKAKDLNESLRELILLTLLTYRPSDPAHHANRLTKRSETLQEIWAHVLWFAEHVCHRSNESHGSKRHRNQWHRNELLAGRDCEFLDWRWGEPFNTCEGEDLLAWRIGVWRNINHDGLAGNELLVEQAFRDWVLD